ILACILKKAGKIPAANHHYERALRFYATLQHAVGLSAAHESWEDSQRTAGVSDVVDGQTVDQTHQVGDILASAAAVLAHHDRLPLVAVELLSVLQKTGLFSHIGATIRRRDGSIRNFGSTPQIGAPKIITTSTPQGTLELHVEGDSCAESLS